MDDGRSLGLHIRYVTFCGVSVYVVVSLSLCLSKLWHCPCRQFVLSEADGSRFGMRVIPLKIWKLFRLSTHGFNRTYPHTDFAMFCTFCPAIEFRLNWPSSRIHCHTSVTYHQNNRIPVEFRPPDCVLDPPLDAEIAVQGSGSASYLSCDLPKSRVLSHTQEAGRRWTATRARRRRCGRAAAGRATRPAGPAPRWTPRPPS